MSADTVTPDHEESYEEPLPPHDEENDITNLDSLESAKVESAIAGNTERRQTEEKNSKQGSFFVGVVSSFLETSKLLICIFLRTQSCSFYGKPVSDTL